MKTYNKFAFTFDAAPSVPLVESTAWGDLVDPREMFYDYPGGGYDAYGFGGGASGIGPLPAQLEDRLNGDHMPIYQCEQDLQFIHGMSHYLLGSCPRSISVKEVLANYTIGTGFEYTIQIEKGITGVPDGLKEHFQRFIDKFIDQNNITNCLDREFHDRSREDGETLIALDPGSDAVPQVNLFEPEQLTEPKDPWKLMAFIEHEYRDYGIDFSVPASWRYGVHTPERQPEQPIGYHFIYCGSFGDWDYYPAERLQHIKRNVPVKAKRGVSDYWWVFYDLGVEAKIRKNIGIGTALNASIAYIREHVKGTTAAQAGGLVTEGRYGTAQVPVQGGGSRTMSLRRHQPGTIIDVSEGVTYREGPLGSNRNPHLLLPGDYILRCIGSRFQIPEYIIANNPANGNFASTLVSESPFVKAREADQEFYAGHYKSLLWKAAKMGWRSGYFDRFAVTFEQLLEWFDINCDMPEVATRDPGALSERNDRDIKNGTLSPRTAMIEAGRDPDQEEKSIAEWKAKNPAPAPATTAAANPAPATPSSTGLSPRSPAMEGAIQGILESADTPEEIRRTLQEIQQAYP